MSHMDQVYTDASFRLVVLGSLSVEQVSQLSSELESGWSTLVDLNRKPKIHYSPCRKLKEQALVKFKINAMLFHCLDNLKVLLGYLLHNRKKGLCH